MNAVRFRGILNFSFAAACRTGVNCGNEVLIRTSVGSYRFEGISREFTRKLYDWEKYRGISPRSSTFRLLGPGYTPFAQDPEAALADEPSSTSTGETKRKSRERKYSLEMSLSHHVTHEIPPRQGSRDPLDPETIQV